MSYTNRMDFLVSSEPTMYDLMPATSEYVPLGVYSSWTGGRVQQADEAGVS